VLRCCLHSLRVRCSCCSLPPASQVPPHAQHVACSHPSSRGSGVGSSTAGRLLPCPPGRSSLPVVDDGKGRREHHIDTSVDVVDAVHWQCTARIDAGEMQLVAAGTQSAGAVQATQCVHHGKRCVAECADVARAARCGATGASQHSAGALGSKATPRCKARGRRTRVARRSTARRRH
jgi:hypothetical protein